MTLDLFDPPAGSIDEAFEAFHERNPEVYAELVAMARKARAQGRQKLGMGMLFEVIRWNRIVEGLPDELEAFKLNNNYRSRYARLIMQREPDLEGFFDTRALRS